VNHPELEIFEVIFVKHQRHMMRSRAPAILPIKGLNASSFIRILTKAMSRPAPKRTVQKWDSHH
jgi:hypothetical protein